MPFTKAQIEQLKHLHVDEHIKKFASLEKFGFSFDDICNFLTSYNNPAEAATKLLELLNLIEFNQSVFLSLKPESVTQFILAILKKPKGMSDLELFVKVYKTDLLDEVILERLTLANFLEVLASANGVIKFRKFIQIIEENRSVFNLLCDLGFTGSDFVGIIVKDGKDLASLKGIFILAMNAENERSQRFIQDNKETIFNIASVQGHAEQLNLINHIINNSDILENLNPRNFAEFCKKIIELDKKACTNLEINSFQDFNDFMRDATTSRKRSLDSDSEDEHLPKALASDEETSITEKQSEARMVLTLSDIVTQELERVEDNQKILDTNRKKNIPHTGFFNANTIDFTSHEYTYAQMMEILRSLAEDPTNEELIANYYRQLIIENGFPDNLGLVKSTVVIDLETIFPELELVRENPNPNPSPG